MRQGPPPRLPSCLPGRNYISQNPMRRDTSRELLFPGDPGGAHARLFPPALWLEGWSQTGRGLADWTRPFPPYFPLIGGAASHPPRRLAPRRVTLPAPSASRRRPLPPGRRGRSSASSRRARCLQDSPGGVWAQRSGINPAVVVAAWSPNRKAGLPLTPPRWRL